MTRVARTVYHSWLPGVSRWFLAGVRFHSLSIYLIQPPRRTDSTKIQLSKCEIIKCQLFPLPRLLRTVSPNVAPIQVGNSVI